MAPSLALLLCCGFVAWLFREDMKWRRLDSNALWVPGIWIAIAASRSPTYWTSYVGLGGRTESTLEGNPLNYVLSVVLIVSALYVLRQRGVTWSAFVQNNKALFFIYFFFAISALWAEYPSVSLRRLFRDFGAVAIALVLLTERDPFAAIRTVYVRVSFLLFSFSVLFYKYFPELGRTYSKGGEPLFCGVATYKNELGQTLMVFILMLIWDTKELWKQEKSAIRKRQLIIHSGCLAITSWLLLVSNSLTPLLCLILGLVLWAAGRYLAGLKSPTQVLGTLLIVGMCLGALNAIFEPKNAILRELGRDPTLSGRTENWPVMLEFVKNPVLGTGYRMFWDVYGAQVEERVGLTLYTEHNGYVQMYCAGGLVGLVLLGIFLLATGMKVAARLLKGDTFGRLGLIFWVLLMVYNCSEASFLWGGSLWFVFLLFAIKPPVALAQSYAASPGLSAESSQRATGFGASSQPGQT